MEILIIIAVVIIMILLFLIRFEFWWLTEQIDNFMTFLLKQGVAKSIVDFFHEGCLWLIIVLFVLVFLLIFGYDIFQHYDLYLAN